MLEWITAFVMISLIGQFNELLDHDRKKVLCDDGEKPQPTFSVPIGEAIEGTLRCVQGQLRVF